MRVETETELSEAIRGAGEPLSVRGGGTRGMAGSGDVLEVGISGVTLYEPGALTLVVGAGTPLSEVEAVLAAEGQRLAFEPMDHRELLGTEGEPTIGGVVAANVSGPRRVAVGACRDFLLGVRFVDGSGSVIKNGGRVMKNVTGLDLARLMCGARGRLGVLSEVSLKVLPRPAAAGVLSIGGLGPAEAVAAMSAALGSPFEVTAASHLPVDSADQPSTQLRIEGTEASVRYRLGRLRDLLAPFGEVTATEASGDWSFVRDVAPFHHGEEDVWRIHVRPSQAAGLVDRLPEGARWLIDWGGGLVWVACAAGTDLRGALGAFEGHATRVRGEGPGALPPEPSAVAALTAGLKARFDPRGILNTGT